MKIEWYMNQDHLTVIDGITKKEIKCWSRVRNEINGFRPNRAKMAKGETDVIFNTNADWSPGTHSVMPRPFPSGDWKVTGYKEHPDPKENNGYLYPVFMRTNAFNVLNVWELDSHGFYRRKTDELVEDHGLGGHFSTNDWTTGCIRIALEEDMRWIWKYVPVGTIILAR